jgi:hypothetical protein
LCSNDCKTLLLQVVSYAEGANGKLIIRAAGPMVTNEKGCHILEDQGRLQCPFAYENGVLRLENRHILKVL